jgi:hypothetical protein
MLWVLKQNPASNSGVKLLWSNRAHIPCSFPRQFSCIRFRITLGSYREYSDNRKQTCDTYLLLVLNVHSWHSTEFQKIIICSSSYLQWSINTICSKWKKLALHYTIPLSHTVYRYSVVLKSNMCTWFLKNPAWWLWLMEGSFFVSAYPRPDGWQQY